jgi:hypothetical protein
VPDRSDPLKLNTLIFFSQPHFLSQCRVRVTSKRNARNSLYFFFLNLKMAQGCEGQKKPVVHGAKFQEGSLRAIGNPKMYKLTQEFFSLTRVRKEDRRWSNYEVFTSPQQYTVTPLHDLFGGSSRTPCGTFHLPIRPLVRPRTQSNNGDTGLGRNDDMAPNRHTSSFVFSI